MQNAECRRQNAGEMEPSWSSAFPGLNGSAAQLRPRDGRSSSELRYGEKDERATSPRWPTRTTRPKGASPGGSRIRAIRVIRGEMLILCALCG